MTAEIAILNKGAVALAADSTVTIGGGGLNGRVKTYNSANKLFTLSKHHPVGVMIYGNAGFMGIPWETVIKQYRHGLGGTAFATIDDYATDFIRFLEASKTIFTDDLQRQTFRWGIHGFFNDFIRAQVNQAVKALAKTRKVTANEIAGIANKQIIDTWAMMDKRMKILPYLTRAFERKLCKNYGKDILSIGEMVFKGMPLTRHAKSCLISIAGRAFCGPMFPNSLSGVVVAGFGEDQIFPAIRTISPHLVVGGRLIYKEEENETYAITHQNSAALIPLAQTDVVDTFLAGIDPEYLRIMDASLDGLSKGLPEQIADHLGLAKQARKSLVGKIRSETVKSHKALAQNLNKYRTKKHVNPLLAIIGHLPKDELAAMAESLVSLTSAKRKMSPEAETVGGPIDVAVISKGDGFIWISRKHYFRQELNPHFARNYLREHRREKNATKTRRRA